MNNYIGSKGAVIVLAAAEVLGAGCATVPMQVAERQIKRTRRQLDRLDERDNGIALGLYSAGRGLDRAQERVKRKRGEYDTLLERFEDRFGRSIDYEAVKVGGDQLTFGKQTTSDGQRDYVLVPVSPGEATDFVGLEVGNHSYTPVAKRKLREETSGLVRFYLGRGGLNISKSYLREHGVNVVYIDTDASVQPRKEDREESEELPLRRQRPKGVGEGVHTGAQDRQGTVLSVPPEDSAAHQRYQERVTASRGRVREAADQTRRNMVRQGLDYLEESRGIVRDFYADVEKVHVGVVEEGARRTTAWMQSERGRRIGELGSARDQVQGQLDKVNEQAEELFEEVFENNPQGQPLEKVASKEGE